MTKGITVSSIL